MKKEIVSELSTYLEVPTFQVDAWDRGVIDYFVSHPEVFSQFRRSGYSQKWNIYHAIRYSGHAANNRSMR